MLDWLAYLLVGRLLVYLWMQFPLSLENHPKLKYLHECDLCSGVWAFGILAYFMQVNLLQEIFYFPILSELITGGAVSFIIHVFLIGWREKFNMVVI